MGVSQLVMMVLAMVIVMVMVMVMMMVMMMVVVMVVVILGHNDGCIVRCWTKVPHKHTMHLSGGKLPHCYDREYQSGRSYSATYPYPSTHPVVFCVSNCVFSSFFHIFSLHIIITRYFTCDSIEQ